MKLPSGRRAFVERMSAMMAPPAAPVPTALKEQRLRDELVEAHGDGLLSWRRADPPMTARSCWWCWRTLMLRWWNSSGRQRLTIPEIAGSNPGLPATASLKPAEILAFWPRPRRRRRSVPQRFPQGSHITRKSSWATL